MSNKKSMQANFSKVDMSYLKTKGSSGKLYICQLWLYMCNGISLRIDICTCMLLHASGLKWRMQFFEGLLCLEVPLERETSIVEFLWTFRVQESFSKLPNIIKRQCLKKRYNRSQHPYTCGIIAAVIPTASFHQGEWNSILVQRN